MPTYIGNVVTFNSYSDSIYYVNLRGNTTQNGVPSPDLPVPIKGVPAEVRVSGLNIAQTTQTSRQVGSGTTVQGILNQGAKITQVTASSGTNGRVFEVPGGKFLTGQQITMSVQMTPGGGAVSPAAYLKWASNTYDSDTLATFTATGSQTLTIPDTIPAGADRLIIELCVASDTSTTPAGAFCDFYVMLTLGTDQPDYEFPEHSTALIAGTELYGNGIYFDEWRTDTGGIDRKFLLSRLTGSESWSMLTPGVFTINDYDGNVPSSDAEPAQIQCSHFPTLSFNAVSSGTLGVALSSTGTLAVCYPIFSTAAAFDAWILDQYNALNPVSILITQLTNKTEFTSPQTLRDPDGHVNVMAGNYMTVYTSTSPIMYVDPETPYREFLNVFNSFVQVLSEKRDTDYKITHSDMDTSNDGAKIQLNNLSSQVRALLGNGGDTAGVLSVNGRVPDSVGNILIRAVNIPHSIPENATLTNVGDILNYLYNDSDTGHVTRLSGVSTNPILVSTLDEPFYYLRGIIQYGVGTPGGQFDLGTDYRAMFIHRNGSSVSLFTIKGSDLELVELRNDSTLSDYIVDFETIITDDKPATVTQVHTFNALPVLSEAPTTDLQGANKKYVDDTTSGLDTDITARLSIINAHLADLDTYKPQEFSGTLTVSGWQPFDGVYVQYLGNTTDGYVPGVPYNLSIAAEEALYGNQIWSINNDGQVGIMAQFVPTIDFSCSVLVQRAVTGGA